MLAREAIEALVPHAGAMCLWDEVLDWDETSIRLRARNHRDAAHPLRSDGRLRAIGKLLYTGEGISHAMALGWRRFGTALVVVAILTALPVAPRVDGTASGLHLVLGLDAGGLYFVVIGCLCIFSIAHLLEQATTLREDSESIV